ncbi:FERM/acyl-CoA-binding protein, 3-helical bundle [Artemisia annua]|uniref:FERM/acyl-CoA-binding protein, 3-helical bundle n=1 Tax=Artemisia annua TaxID=35608 RepID=A0A2U1MCJ1_ARTAN|nr:FERM/acyl-CoA-binding protein, 3-helical bundle [Artemisia annua]
MIASFIFCMLITKITASISHKKIKVVRKSKSSKKVRFALEHEEFFINEVVDEPLEKKAVVFKAEILDESMTLVDEKNLGNCVKLTCDDEDVKEDIGLISDEDDDDWRGVEKSDGEMEFYGLHKVATEGPCREVQPMASNVST